ncbi:hypothetical protein K1719_021099 [Acacia pycnantha]|nr:hypothetical protein K1719_021099 [Acacia pycnantha]
MQIVAMAETVIYMNMDDSSENYCLRLLIREWAQFCIFSYIGGSSFILHMLVDFQVTGLDATRFSVMPATKCKGDSLVPPIYSNPTCGCGDKSSEGAVLVIIEHPHSQRLRTVLDTSSSRSAHCSAASSNLTSQISSSSCQI